MQVMFSFNLRITKDRHSLCLRNRVGTSGWTDGQGGQFTSAAAKSHHHHHHLHHHHHHLHRHHHHLHYHHQHHRHCCCHCIVIVLRTSGRTDLPKVTLSLRSCHPGLGLASKSDWEYLNNEPIGKIGIGALNPTFYLRIHVLIKIYGPIERNQNCWVNLKKVAKWLRVAKLGLNAAASCGSVAGPATHTLNI